MVAKFNVYIGLDPGLLGGISILDGKKTEIYEIPLLEKVVNSKKKRFYDLSGIVDILKQYKNKDVLFVQEAVAAMRGQGVTSMFNFGKSAGSTLGIATALGFEIVEVYPQTWKKYYSNMLVTPEISQFKHKIKDLKAINKNIKDKEVKSSNNKEIKQIQSKIKSLSKASSRRVAGELFPDLKDNFKKVKNDGLAESLLLAYYGLKNELVLQNSK